MSLVSRNQAGEFLRTLKTSTPPEHKRNVNGLGTLPLCEHSPNHGCAVAAAGLPTRGLRGPASARQGRPAEPPASMQDQAHVLPTPSTDPPHPILSVWYRADLRMAVANDRHADIR